MDLNQETILAVDDNPANLSVLFDALEGAGYRVLINSRGESALEIAAEVKPDLILLDVMMPGLDGFETCRRLKQNKETEHIPVIFMTALTDVVDEVKGLQLGAVDYITKPIQVERVLVRVRTHLTIRRLQRQLEEQNVELNAFAHTVAHDLKNPLGNLVSYSSFLAELRRQPDFSPASTEMGELVQGIFVSAQKAVYIVDELLLLASVRKEQVLTKTIKMAAVIDQALQRTDVMVKQYQGRLTVPNQWPVAMGYGPWIEEVWVNYISNGLKYGGRPPQLELGATLDTDGMVQFWVKDNGQGLAPEAQAKLFTEFSRLDTIRVQGYGLGLSIVKRIVQKLGGQVGVESQVGQGSKFFFTLPAATD